MAELENLLRCPAEGCTSPVFYDWGLELLSDQPVSGVTGHLERYDDWASRSHIKICVRCTTPYIIEAGKLIDLSAELGREDVMAIIARGQATLPHPQRKDP